VLPTERTPQVDTGHHKHSPVRSVHLWN